MIRRLCNSWTKRDDDKADTSRMDDDNNEVVEMADENEIKMLKTQMGSYGHKPLHVVRGDADVNKTTQELGQETNRGLW